MTPAQRHAAFNRLFADLARRRAARLRLGYAGTIRKLAPPALPGEKPGANLYFLNAVAADGKGSGLVPLGREADAELRRAEKWVESGIGPAPDLVPRSPKVRR